MSGNASTWVPRFQKALDRALRWLAPRLDPAGQDQMRAVLLQALARYAYRDPATAARFFPMAQSMGFHLLPVHFYSPVPNTAELPDKLWERRFDETPGWNLRRDEQLALLERLSARAPEMAETPADRRPGDPPHAYYWNNTQFNGSDAVVYHSLIRELRPRRILEVGCGFSTMVSARAARMNGDTRIECVEPFPREELRGGIPGVERLIEKPLQEVETSLFTALESGDFLFFDGTHVSRIGSDVNHLVFEILPRLKPGVYVHVHDIFLPGEYPKHWVKDHHLFWTEQYLLLAFLLFNGSFEVIFAGHYIGEYERERLVRAFPYLPAYGGCSFWMRRKPEPA